MVGKYVVGLSCSITRSQSQKSTCKDLRPKWPKPSHLGLRPLTLRFLGAPVRAQQKKIPNNFSFGIRDLAKN
ncbi:hypothetical protein FEI15_11720 [Lacticaseibacillus zeae]|uniref:Uncharacterized protein n=1 Tax=Lacticaseibacillus zeae TaxID=57037 RepID=A0A5R8LLI8_LACZE|nr:hypothetical protein FEI15_11720 [Lacticaseibacillus zeae]